MASDTSNSLCLENIDEFVHDENKIVTCKWLSLTLKIHINQSKQLLYTFLQQQRQKDKDVNATYFLAGLSKGDNGHMQHECLVVGEGDLASTRSRLAVVTSCHVYSVQRVNLKDSNALYLTDYEGLKENLSECSKFSSIHCQRATVERQVPKREETLPDKPKPKDTNHNVQKTNGSTGDKPVSTAPPGGKGKKADPKGSIASMFASTNKKVDADAGKKKDAIKKEDTKENKPAHKKGSVLGMFANAKPPAKEKKEEEENKKTLTKPVEEEKKNKKTLTKPVEEEKKNKKTLTKPVEEEKKKTLTKPGKKAQEKKDKTSRESKSKKKSKRADDSDEEEAPEKKRRRRIKNDLFDSSSEEEEEILIDDDESPVPSPVHVREETPEPESPVPKKKRTSEKPDTKEADSKDDRPVNGSKLRRRKRKLVPKTYLDDDGFMVTEKVWESDSTDASEVEPETTKKAAPQKKKNEPAPAKKASPQKKAPPAKGNQASIMSFFKKK